MLVAVLSSQLLAGVEIDVPEPASSYLARSKYDRAFLFGSSKIDLTNVVFCLSSNRWLSLIRKDATGYHTYFVRKPLDKGERDLVFESELDEELADSLTNLWAGWLRLAKYNDGEGGDGSAFYAAAISGGVPKRVYEGEFRTDRAHQRFSSDLLALVSGLDNLTKVKSYHGLSQKELDRAIGLTGVLNVNEVDNFIRDRRQGVVADVAALQKRLDSYLIGQSASKK